MSKLPYLPPESGIVELSSEQLVCQSINSGAGAGDLNIYDQDPWTPIL